MKTSIFSLSALALSGVASAAPASSQSEPSPAHGNAKYGPADPLTLAMRVEASRQKMYGDKSVAQSQVQEQAQVKAASAASAGCGTNCNSTLSFAGSAAKAFEVGNSIPTVGFKTKTSWAGNLPIAKSTSKELYFWLWGAETPSDDLVIWLNGGPGCSSLSGFLQENGPIDYGPGKSAPTDATNSTSWTQLANVLYLEQPIGTGFTVGTPYAKNEDDVATAVSGFLDNFYQTFPELQSKKLWITGESYAGKYIPYISEYLYKNGNKHNLQGVWIIDGVIAAENALNYLVTSDFVATNNDKYLHLSQSDINKINADADSCGYGHGANSYVAKNLKYPATGPLPPYNASGCSTFDDYYSAAQNKNSAFNIYYIAQTTEPNPPSVLGDPNSPTQSLHKTFFDNYSLQSYIHAPHKKWNLCNSGVFPNGDSSPAPDQNNLAYVIESAPSKRNIISNGNLDGLIMTNGTALALQNLTWNGAQGFTTPPSANKFIDTKGNWAGGYVTERGLTFNTVFEAGHEIPQYTPYSGLKLLSYLLGKTASLGA